MPRSCLYSNLRVAADRSHSTPLLARLYRGWNVYSCIHTPLSSMLIVISVHTEPPPTANIELDIFKTDSIHTSTVCVCTKERERGGTECGKHRINESGLPHSHMYWIAFVSIVCLLYVHASALCTKLTLYFRSVACFFPLPFCSLTSVHRIYIAYNTIYGVLF